MKKVKLNSLKFAQKLGGYSHIFTTGQIALDKNWERTISR